MKNLSYLSGVKMKKYFIIGGLVAVVAAAAVYFLFFYKNLDQQIVIPYISHQNPRVDPHIPSSVLIADKLDEVLFDGLFNISANPSGIVYENGLGELMGIDENNVVSIRLKPKQKWHASYEVKREKDEIQIQKAQDVYFNAEDLRFTMQRIQRLGSLSPDYILISQAIEGFRFNGPDNDNLIKFKFRDDRIWTDVDIKEVLSFKILPAILKLRSFSDYGACNIRFPVRNIINSTFQISINKSLKSIRILIPGHNKMMPNIIIISCYCLRSYSLSIII